MVNFDKLMEKINFRMLTYLAILGVVYLFTKDAGKAVLASWIFLFFVWFIKPLIEKCIKKIKKN